MRAQAGPAWPDPLSPPDPGYAVSLLSRFWRELEPLPGLLLREEHILAEQLTSSLRRTVIEMMLAANGISWPQGTQHLNGYLGASQRAVLERTLAAPAPDAAAWMARAVALIVIYRWYAPQLAEAFGGALPRALEERVLQSLAEQLPDWPRRIETE